MKKIICFLIISMLWPAFLEARSNQQNLKNQIQGLASQIYNEAQSSQRSDIELEPSRKKLQEVLNVIQKRPADSNSQTPPPPSGPIAIFTSADAQQCMQLYTVESQRICLKNRVANDIAKACMEKYGVDNQRNCLKQNARPGSSRNRRMTPEDIRQCDNLYTYESQKICGEYRVPSELSKACQQFYTVESQRICLKAN